MKFLNVLKDLKSYWASLKILYRDRHNLPLPAPPVITISSGAWSHKFTTYKIKLDAGVKSSNQVQRSGISTITLDMPNDVGHVAVLKMLSRDPTQTSTISVAMSSGSEFEYRDCIYLHCQDRSITFQTFNRHSISPEVSGGWSVE